MRPWLIVACLAVGCSGEPMCELYPPSPSPDPMECSTEHPCQMVLCCCPYGPYGAYECSEYCNQCPPECDH